MRSKFIEMSTRNRNIRIPVRNEIVLLFDIDYCLFHSPEMDAYEMQRIKDSFIELSEADSDEWESHLKECRLYREIFHKRLNIQPRDYAQRYDVMDFDKFICPDPELISCLKLVSARKFCFTNGTRFRAEKILQHLQLTDVFESVFCGDCEEHEFICKPNTQAYEFVEEVLEISDRSKVYFFDDNQDNIEKANQIGWNGILVNGNILSCVRDVASLCSLINSQLECEL